MEKLENILDDIKTTSSSVLKEKNLLSQKIKEWGLNGEKPHEMPVSWHPYCGNGLKIWQNPDQFADYLIWLSDKNIRSYFEIGSRWGGTFITTVEYLNRFNKINYAYAIDLIESDILLNYSLINHNIKFIKISSQDSRLDLLPDFDLTLVDGSHKFEDVTSDYYMFYPKSKYIVLHDIVNQACPGVKKFWEAHSNNSLASFVEQDETSPGIYFGLGIVAGARYV